MTRYGITLPVFDALADARVLAECAAEGERAGWDGVFVWDHMLYSDPVEAIADPWIAMTAMALATERVQIGAMVTPLSRRRPWVLARQAVTLDRLSHGRLVLGFGLGDDGRNGELSRFGEQTDPKLRARMLDEGLVLTRDLLSGETVHHRGEYYAADGVRFRPRPHDDRTIPFWLAARWPNRAPLRRAARYDGVFVIGLPDPAAVAELVAFLREQREGDLTGFDVVVQPPGGADPAAWAGVEDVTWILSGPGPFGLDLDAVRTLIRSGPPTT